MGSQYPSLEIYYTLHCLNTFAYMNYTNFNHAIAYSTTWHITPAPIYIIMHNFLKSHIHINPIIKLLHTVSHYMQLVDHKILRTRGTDVTLGKEYIPTIIMLLYCVVCQGQCFLTIVKQHYFQKLPTSHVNAKRNGHVKFITRWEISCTT